jgi:thiamine biosynthesis lipoprotein
MSHDERVFEVMGTTAHVIVVGGPSNLVERGAARLAELEGRWSRFRSDSELSRLNERSGVPVVVSPETYLLVERALDGRRITTGLFDPTLLPELRDAGYDRSFELIEHDDPPRAVEGGDGRAHRADSNPRSPDRSRTEAIQLDPIVRSIRLPSGVEIDPGGIGKGLAADMVVELLRAEGAAGAMVNVGGDLAASGVAPDGGGWTVAVADPSDADRIAVSLTFAEGAVASSWRTKRTWTRGGVLQHHVIDPKTGLPARSRAAGATVIAGAGWRAEVLAKAVLLAEPGDAARIVADNEAAGIAFADDGTVREFGNIEPYLARDLDRVA